MFLHVSRRTKKCCACASPIVVLIKHELPHMPLQNVINQTEILFTDMHGFLTPSRSGAELLYWQLQVSLCGWVQAYLFVHVCFSGKFSFSLANWIALLQAKSLATEIKQLCFVVMVHKILIKTRLPSRNLTKETRRSALRVQYVKKELSLRFHWSQLIRTSSLNWTWHAHFKHHWHTVHSKSFNWCCEGWTLECVHFLR